ncbi:MAG TPA: threonine synthase [Candidatus Angelobacter sp.]|jgi:threonine synthase|nr:threonine synthase [Candidatus Angelobacter sp.]
MSTTVPYELKCRECQATWGNQPVSFCQKCFAPVEVSYDMNGIRQTISRDEIARRPNNLWRYKELLPLPEDFEATLPVGFTPLVRASQLGERFHCKSLYIKNDSVCFPSLSFKDRVVAVALAQAGNFGFEIVSCSSTGNLANAVAAQAARGGFKACIFIPADLEPAKILGTVVYGAKIVRIAGNYDHVNRLCTQIADKYPWGFVNVNLRPYYAEGSKTVGFEIAEQLGWRLPDNVVVPMAGGALITKIAKAFRELTELGFVEAKNVKFFGAQATGCSPITAAVKAGRNEIEPQKPNTIARSLAIGNPADGFYAAKTIVGSGGWGEDASDPEIVDAITLLAETEGIFTETAGGVTVAAARKLYAQGRIKPEETTVLCITGNGLKTTDALAGRFEAVEPIQPKLAAFEEYLERELAGTSAKGAA